MSEPVSLDEAIVALRATRGDTTDAAGTFARICESLDRPRAGEVAASLVRVPGRYYSAQAAAALLFGLVVASSSYAAFFGLPAGIRGWFGEEARAAKEAPVSRASRATTPRAAPARSPNLAPQVSSPAPTAESPEGPEVEPAPATRSSPTPQAAEMRAVRSAPSRQGARRQITAEPFLAPPAPEAMPTPDEIAQLYREAHNLHFVTREYPAALQAWQRYLRVAGDSTLAVEARYNRALCLVRIGDHVEARAALQAIADGEQGAYRQREARALLKVLR